METQTKIIEIGQRGHCTNEELHHFLPNYPIINGVRYIFNYWNWRSISKWSKIDIENFVKGLHFIELKYRELKQSDFGFGSPSKTAFTIDKLNNHQKELAEELREWVKANGGNYYIKPPKPPESLQIGLFGELKKKLKKN